MSLVRTVACGVARARISGVRFVGALILTLCGVRVVGCLRRAGCPVSDDRPACAECGAPARMGGLRCADCYEAART